MQAMRWLLFTDTAQLDPRSNSSSTTVSNAALATRVHGDSASRHRVLIQPAVVACCSGHDDAPAI